MSFSHSPKRYALLVAELLKDPAWQPFQSLQKLLGGNLLRVMDNAHQVSELTETRLLDRIHCLLQSGY